MTIAPNTIHETFSRSLSGQWGQSDSGALWRTPNGTGFSVSDGFGRYNAAINSASNVAYCDLDTIGVPKQTADEVLMRLDWQGGVAYPLTDFGPALSVVDANNYYYVALQGNWSELSLNARVNGYRWELNRTSNVTLVKDRQYWIRFRRTSTGLFVRIWAVGTTEPAAWTLTSGLWDGSYPPGAGSPGMHFRGTRDQYNVRVYDMYYFTQEESTPTTNASDNFARSVSDSWGVLPTGHRWEGSVSSDPEAPNDSVEKWVESANGGRAVLVTNWNEKVALINTSRSGDSEMVATFLMGGAADGVGCYRVGLNGQRNYLNGVLRPRGYMLQMQTGNGSVGVYKKVQGNNNWIYLTEFAIPTGAILINTIYKVRFQIKGQVMKGKVWPDGQAEPPAWMFSRYDSDLSSGAGFIEMANTTGSTRAFYTYNVDYIPPTPDMVVPTPEDPNPPPLPRNFTTSGTISVVPNSTTDTSTRLKITWTDDVDNNVAITPYWKKSNTSDAWSTTISNPVYNRTNKTYEFTISGLTRGQNYEVHVYYADGGGIQGPNPLITIFSTTSLGVEAGTAKIVSITGNQASIEATYAADLDNTSTAALASRVTSQATYLVEDFFVDAKDGQQLQNYDSGRGGDWIRHTASSVGIESIFRLNGFYVNAKAKSDKVLYYQTQSPPSAEVTVTGNYYFGVMAGAVGVAGRINPNFETYYGAGINPDLQRWELFKVTNGVKVVLSTAPFVGDLKRIYKISLDISNARKNLVVDDKLVATHTDNTIASGNTGYYYAGGVEEGTLTNQITLGSFFSHYRSALGAWVEHGAMTPNRGLKKFNGVATGLLSDTIYEFRVTYSDSSTYGLNTGINPALVVGMTPGRASLLYLVGASTTYQSAIVSAFIMYDTNRNSTMEFQYKATTEGVWSTVSFQKVTKYRDIGRFDLTLSGLDPSTTYEIKITISDPDGLFEGSPSVLHGLFSTKGFIPVGSEQEKYYLWKVYDRAGNYLSTIHDAPAPEFSLHENGGTTDLELNLYRKFSEMSIDKIIDFQHRIDIWAIDPSSSGLGPSLITDPDADIGGWVVGQTSGTYGRNSSIDPTGGPDGGSALKIVSGVDTEWPQASNPIHVGEEVPLVISCIAKAVGAKLRLYAQSFSATGQVFDTSNDQAETVGTDWQKLQFEYTPPVGTEYIRVVVENDARGTMWADKFDVRAKEVKIYSGNIESFTPKIDDAGETVSIQVLGLASFLSDDYIEFLQFVDSQPSADIAAGRINNGSLDPADMLKRVIDVARTSNPRFPLYYTSESIRSTGTLMQYTFRDTQIRHCFDKIRDLCPAGWHYFIHADGLVTLRGPEHAQTHYLRLGVEISTFEVEKSIRNLKNYVRVKGRQDEDRSELGSEGTIHYVTFDQASIDKHGKRVIVINDSQIIDQETARLVGDGRLEEHNREEQRAECTIPDEKLLKNSTGSLKGYNIEAFIPGDNVIIVDPFSGPRYSYWNQMSWTENHWDINDVFHPVPAGVPIKTIRYKADQAELELSERPPSQVGDYSKLYRWMAIKDKE